MILVRWTASGYICDDGWAPEAVHLTKIIIYLSNYFVDP
jgi:hypothetical protein